ncbi:SsrA-binding protein SmpB [bacterium]|jgi:SsrA-binding protein|nr:SsrA-binding protein SmpB [bacterium]
MTLIQKNKKAYHDYFIIKEYEAGIKLKGSEVKAIRKGSINLKGSFCKIFKDELFLFDCHISKYKDQNAFDTFEETRDRKLLLKRREINYLKRELELNQGYSIVPTLIYFNDKNTCKLKIALVQGKKTYDKRETQKNKDVQRKLQNKDWS